ncbi:MAG: hypothetical protein K1X83_07230 [Oligoflexia bacterium]|nr:hypothetical protein [Oligoflexia bacterium]
MLVIIGSGDHFLGNHISGVLDRLELRKIRTIKLDRIIRELKQPDRLVIIDLSWKEVQKPGVLRQMVNIGRISGNQVICVTPNDDDKLKKIAQNARPEEVFLRYDLETGVKEFLEKAAQDYLDRKTAEQ